MWGKTKLLFYLIDKISPLKKRWITGHIYPWCYFWQHWKNKWELFVIHYLMHHEWGKEDSNFQQVVAFALWTSWVVGNDLFTNGITGNVLKNAFIAASTAHSCLLFLDMSTLYLKNICQIWHQGSLMLINNWGTGPNISENLSRL